MSVAPRLGARPARHHADLPRCHATLCRRRVHHPPTKPEGRQFRSTLNREDSSTPKPPPLSRLPRTPRPPRLALFHALAHQEPAHEPGGGEAHQLGATTRAQARRIRVGDCPSAHDRETGGRRARCIRHPHEIEFLSPGVKDDGEADIRPEPLGPVRSPSTSSTLRPASELICGRRRSPCASSTASSDAICLTSPSALFCAS